MSWQRGMSQRLRVNPIACEAHGMCAELLPERISLDEWGYPYSTGSRCRRTPRACRARRTGVPDVRAASRASPRLTLAAESVTRARATGPSSER